MRKIALAASFAAAALALTACGDSRDASEDAEAETVEEPAAEAMEEVIEEPVLDTDMSPREEAPAGPPVEQRTLDQAADDAEAAVADFEAIANEAEASNQE
ncbi:hypothetical protein [Parerythrobacter lacustris]|uniref:Uncharacterized protein n=1 Tax=Parerythrobacter lacustris TaxID=2969984 RepID=A0ABT1XLF6_9SPHN|nr:hypothetical protein [Parerythrobacter lacustris]MCR2832496.1 hypothetical protein [Parerythrobacter lacustris]